MSNKYVTRTSCGTFWLLLEKQQQPKCPKCWRYVQNMELRMKYPIIIISAMLLNVYSATAVSAPQTFTPTFVGCFPSGTCFIGVSPMAETTCPNKGQIRFDITLPGSNAQYSTALSSYMAGKKLVINVTDTCLDNYPTPNYLHTAN